MVREYQMIRFRKKESINQIVCIHLQQNVILSISTLEEDLLARDNHWRD